MTKKEQSNMSTVFTFQKLHIAYLHCRKHKRHTANALSFELDLEKNLFLLQEELISKTYRPGKSMCFVVEKPVIREIFAVDFRDRIVHHLLVSEVLRAGERSFVADSFACRKNKGTHKAVMHLKSQMRKVSENFTTGAWYAQLDIAGFFMSIQQKRLYEIFSKLVLDHKKPAKWKEDILWLGEVLIFHTPTENYFKKGNPSLFDLVPRNKSLFYSSLGAGLPIGNYTSQFFANLYLNELDQYVKRTLGIRHYVRYVDDFILLAREEKALREAVENIQTFLSANLSLSLHPGKTKIREIKKGIDFLGYFIKPSHTLVRRRVVSECKRKIRDFLQKSEDISEIRKMIAIVNSYFGHFRYAESYHLRKSVVELRLKEFSLLIEPVERFVYVTLRKSE